jgi:hypothetical protein
MPDITMCKGQVGGIICPYKDKCYRYTAEPNKYRQSFFVELPIKDAKCDYYWGDNAESIWNQLKEITKDK